MAKSKKRAAAKAKPVKKLVAKAKAKPAAPPVPTQADIDADVAGRIAQAQAEADKEIMAMGKLIGDTADQKLKEMLDRGVISHSSEETQHVGPFIAAIRLGMQRGGRIGGVEGRKSVKVDASKPADGALRVIVSYVEEAGPAEDAE